MSLEASFVCADQPRVDDGRLLFFAFNIHLPDASSSRFGIFHDVAELLDLEYQEDAVAAFRREAKSRDPVLLRRLRIDWESGSAFIDAAKPDSILFAALVLNDIAVSPHHRLVDGRVEDELRALLRSWKRPKRHPWRKGDVFAAPLSDGSYAHGQVLKARHRSPTCALLDVRSPAPESGVEAVIGARVLSILHLGPDLLDQGLWTIIGNASPVVDPDSGPCGDGFSVGDVSFGSGTHLVDLAEAYWGIKPWNVGWYGEDDFFGNLLMADVARPDSAWILSPEERARYRAERGITA